MRYFLSILFFNLILSQVHFSDIPENTGVSHMIVIENIIGLDIGDEVGLFDTNGLLSSGDCSDQYGDLLVGAGIYNGEQMNIVGIGSIDFCDFTDGYQLSGWVDGNPISIKVWDASEDIEYIPEVIYNQGSNNWGNNFSVIDIIIHQLSIDEIEEFSIIATYPNPFNSFITFAPNFPINEDINISIFNIYGQIVDNFLFKQNDKSSIVWDASNHNSGIYFVNFKSSKTLITKKISLIK